MRREAFFISNKMSASIEDMIANIDTFEEFDKRFSQEFLDDDCQIGRYLEELLWTYEKDYATISQQAGLAPSYVGLIVRGKKNNPSRDALIAICLAIGTTVEEVQYLLKYAGHSPLYVRRRRDVIIWFGFKKHKSVIEVNMYLYEHGYKPLGRSH